MVEESIEAVASGEVIQQVSDRDPSARKDRSTPEHVRVASHNGFKSRHVRSPPDLHGTPNGRRCLTCVISESIPGDLTPPQLLAVLAHEAAHVCLNHFRRKLAWGAVAGMLGLVATVAAQMAVAPFLPRDLGIAGVLVVVLPIGILRGLYETFVVRHHEAEADEFAVVVAGAPALLDALGVLGGSGPPEALVHNRWTTHSTWERRARRIREWERSRIAGYNTDWSRRTYRLVQSCHRGARLSRKR